VWTCFSRVPWKALPRTHHPPSPLRSASMTVCACISSFYREVCLAFDGRPSDEHWKVSTNVAFPIFIRMARRPSPRHPFVGMKPKHPLRAHRLKSLTPLLLCFMDLILVRYSARMVRSPVVTLVPARPSLRDFLNLFFFLNFIP